MSNPYQLYIDGEFCDASDGGTLESINPATGEVWTSAASATEADVDRAVTAAHRALREGPWSEMTATKRGQMLYKLAERIAAVSEMLGEIETTDPGKLAAETKAQTA